MAPTEQNYKFSIISLYKAIPEYIEYSSMSSVEVMSALLYIKNLCTVSKTIDQLKLDLRSEIKVENRTLSTIRKTGPLEKLYNILFGTLDDLPLYISQEGYEILVNFRFHHL